MFRTENGLVLVKITNGVGPYVAGEVAGFEDGKHEKIVKAGNGVYVDPDGQPLASEPVADAPEPVFEPVKDPAPPAGGDATKPLVEIPANWAETHINSRRSLAAKILGKSFQDVSAEEADDIIKAEVARRAA